VSDEQAASLSPETVLKEMKKHGITHVVWLPDSETNWLYLLMKADPELTLVAVAREGLAFSVAAGLHAGGKKPVILIQNTGVMESGDSMRGWGLGMNLPVVMMVGYRGYMKNKAPVDTAATYIEPFLKAFGIQYYLVESDADAPRISVAFEEAETKRRPVAVLVGDEYHGFNK
jgi:sulfopyruvate decarboxylase subunit alpha